MCKYGVSFVELLILFEIWLLRDKGPNKRPGRLLVVSPSHPPLSSPPPPPSPTALLHSPPGIQIRVEYKVPSSLLRSLPLWRVVWPGLCLAAWRSSLHVVTNLLSGLWRVSYLVVMALNCHFWGTGRGRLLMWLMVC